MKRTFLVIYCLLLPLLALAKVQTEDHVVMGDESHFVRADPLNSYLSYHCKEERLEQYVNNFCDPYWPDYTRYWEIKDERLYLVKIMSDNKEVEYPLELLFPRYDGTPIEAKWFSGILSYRFDDSPVIQLNHEFYEEELVVRVVKGAVVERFKINHRKRWMEYAQRIMDKYCPLGGNETMELPEEVTSEEGFVAEYLYDALAVVTNPEKKPSIYAPLIYIELNADLDDFRFREVHKDLTCYELLEAVARETQCTLDIAVSNRVVIYEINERDAGDVKPLASPVVEQAAQETPSS